MRNTTDEVFAGSNHPEDTGRNPRTPNRKAADKLHARLAAFDRDVAQFGDKGRKRPGSLNLRRG